MKLRIAFLAFAVVACSDRDVPSAPLDNAPGPPAFSISPGGESYGVVVTNIYHAERGDMADLEAARLAEHARQSGAGWARVAIYGNTNQDIFSVKTVEALQAKGIKVFATLMWGGGYAAMPTTQEWTDFVTWAIAAHPGVIAYGIGNESNCDEFFTGTDGQYDQWVQIASPLIRSSGRQVVIGDYAMMAAACSGSSWLDQRMSKLAGLYDVVSVHGYPQPPGFDAGPLITEVSSWATKASNRGAQLWVTETGAYAQNDEVQRSVVATWFNGMASVTNWTKTFIFHLYTAEPGGYAWISHWIPGSGETRAVINPRPSYLEIAERACQGKHCARVARWHGQWSVSHFYSTDPSEVDGSPWFIEDGDSFFFVRTRASEGFRPIWQCWSPDAHKLTRTEADCSENGFVPDRLLGYISPDSLPGMTKLSRFYRQYDTDYLSVNCRQDREAAVLAGYEEQDELGWVHSYRCFQLSP